MSNKDYYNLDTSWIDNVQINLSAVERRTTTLTKRRTVKKEFQVAWLLKAVTLIDLTIAVVSEGQVYTFVLLVVVKSTLAFLYVLAIMENVLLQIQRDTISLTHQL